MNRPVNSPDAQMLIYSGRPDPKWSMSIDQWNELKRLMGSLPERTEHAGRFEVPSILGYRGFQSTWNDEEVYFIAQTKQAVHVQRDSFIVYEDPSKLIETWFVDNAKTRANLDLPIPSN